MQAQEHDLDAAQDPQAIPDADEVQDLKCLYGGSIERVLSGQREAIERLSAQTGTPAPSIGAAHARDIIIEQARAIVTLSAQAGAPLAAAYYWRLKEMI
jgi:hypothetical protein